MTQGADRVVLQGNTDRERQDRRQAKWEPLIQSPGAVVLMVAAVANATLMQLCVQKLVQFLAAVLVALIEVLNLCSVAYKTKEIVFNAHLVHISKLCLSQNSLYLEIICHFNGFEKANGGFTVTHYDKSLCK